MDAGHAALLLVIVGILVVGTGAYYLFRDATLDAAEVDRRTAPPKRKP